MDVNNDPALLEMASTLHHVSKADVSVLMEIFAVPALVEGDSPGIPDWLLLMDRTCYEGW